MDALQEWMQSDLDVIMVGARALREWKESDPGLSWLGHGCSVGKNGN